MRESLLYREDVCARRDYQSGSQTAPDKMYSAKQLGNVSQGCKMMGCSRDRYRFRELYDQGGELTLPDPQESGRPPVTAYAASPFPARPGLRRHRFVQQAWTSCPAAGEC
jgi:hypothetical protein